MENIGLPPQWKVYGNIDEPQKPYDVSVVMPSIGRKEIIKAISSIFQQNVNRIQVLIGIDKPQESLLFLDEFLQNCPNHITVNIFYPGYSTSVRHGGITLAKDGGALRSTLTQLANSKYVAYLDDDNWWDSTHLSDLLSAIKNKARAFSLRYFVHPHSKKNLYRRMGVSWSW
jgi:glycosyltransferase involved in cell wall biosynthesis